MKVKGPLLSLNAHGSLGDTITFSKRRSHIHVRNKQKQNRKITKLQAEHRKLIELCSLKWRNLSSSEQDDYNTLGGNSNPQLTGFQYFCKVAMQAPQNYLDVVAYWPLMNWTSDDMFNDISGNDHHLQILGADAYSCLYQKFNTRKNPWRFMKKRGYLHLLSTEAIDLDLTWNNFTIFFLCKLDTYDTTDVLFKNFESGTPGKGIISYISNTYISIGIYQGASISYFGFTSFAPYLTDFAFYTFVFSNSKIYGYVNGHLVQTKNIIEFTPNTDNGWMFLYDYYDSSEKSRIYLNGFGIMNRALSADEVHFMALKQKLYEAS